MPNNTVVVPISLPKEMAKALNKSARDQSMTRSEYVRDILRQKLAFAKMAEFRREFSRKAKKIGIRTLPDAVRAVREIRGAK